jgi:hypothetical protein
VTLTGTEAVLTMVVGGVSVNAIVGVGVEATMAVTADAELAGVLADEDAVTVTTLPVGTEDGAV